MNKASKIKKISAICAAFMFALLSIFAALITQKEEIRASAEETTATEERIIYPTDNLFDASVINKDAGVSVSGNSISYDGKSWFNAGDGSAWSFLSFGSFSTLFPFCSVGETYTFSCTVVYSGDIPSGFPCFSILIYGVDFGIDSVCLVQRNVIGYVTCTFTVSEKMLKCPIYAYGCNQGKENLWRDIMLNSGSVAYPYRPVNKVLYDDGKKDGFNQGYQDASDTLNLGVLKGSKISASLTYSDNTKATITNEDPTFTYNGIDFRPSRDKWEASKMLENAFVTVNFADSFSYKAFPLRFQGSSDVMSGTFLSTDGKKYSFNIERTDLLEGVVPGQFVISGSYPVNLQIKSVTIQFGRATDTLEGVLLSVSGQYQNGYANGYNDGFADNDSYSKGYVAGRDFGYNNGYNAGLAEGSAENGFAGLLFAVIDTPVKAFSSLLNFEILGVNMKSFVLSVLTLALFVVVVRWLLGKA